jgi:hypothetical protein
MPRVTHCNRLGGRSFILNRTSEEKTKAQGLAKSFGEVLLSLMDVAHESTDG